MKKNLKSDFLHDLKFLYSWHYTDIQGDPYYINLSRKRILPGICVYFFQRLVHFHINVGSLETGFLNKISKIEEDLAAISHMNLANIRLLYVAMRLPQYLSQQDLVKKISHMN